MKNIPTKASTHTDNRPQRPADTTTVPSTKPRPQFYVIGITLPFLLLSKKQPSSLYYPILHRESRMTTQNRTFFHAQLATCPTSPAAPFPPDSPLRRPKAYSSSVRHLFSTSTCLPTEPCSYVLNQLSNSAYLFKNQQIPKIMSTQFTTK